MWCLIGSSARLHDAGCSIGCASRVAFSGAGPALPRITLGDRATPPRCDALPKATNKTLRNVEKIYRNGGRVCALEHFVGTVGRQDGWRVGSRLLDRSKGGWKDTGQRGHDGALPGRGPTAGALQLLSGEPAEVSSTLIASDGMRKVSSSTGPVRIGGHERATARVGSAFVPASRALHGWQWAATRGRREAAGAWAATGRRACRAVEQTMPRRAVPVRRTPVCTGLFLPPDGATRCAI